MRTIPNTPRAGLMIMAAAMIIAPGMDVFAKLLTDTTSPGQITLGRFLVQSAVLLPIVLLAGQWSRPQGGHWLAGVFLALALVCINAAFAVMPIVNALAIFFVEPLVLTLLSALILRETIGWRRVAAVVVGLIGALIVIRPNWAAYGPTALLPLATAVFFSCYMLVTKVMATGPNKLALQLWTGISALAFLTIANLAGNMADIPIARLTAPVLNDVPFYLGMGLLAILSHQMIVHALARADASLAAPLQYLEIVSATIFGWLVFRDFPDPLTWLGTAIIIAAGLYVIHRERRAGQESV